MKDKKNMLEVEPKEVKRLEKKIFEILKKEFYEVDPKLLQIALSRLARGFSIYRNETYEEFLFNTTVAVGEDVSYIIEDIERERDADNNMYI